MLVTSKKEIIMKRLLLVLIAAAMLSGCAAWEEYKRDYLKGDEYHDNVLPEAYEEYKDNYLDR